MLIMIGDSSAEWGSNQVVMGRLFWMMVEEEEEVANDLSMAEEEVVKVVSWGGGE